MITRQGEAESRFYWVIVANPCRLSRDMGISRRRSIRVDTAASESLGISVQHCAILREVVEELGLAPQEGRLVSVEDDFRGMVVDDKANWFPLALDGDIPCDTSGMRIISMRTTPPFGPVRFENTFLHIHADATTISLGRANRIR